MTEGHRQLRLPLRTSSSERERRALGVLLTITTTVACLGLLVSIIVEALGLHSNPLDQTLTIAGVALIVLGGGIVAGLIFRPLTGLLATSLAAMGIVLLSLYISTATNPLAIVLFAAAVGLVFTGQALQRTIGYWHASSQNLTLLNQASQALGSTLDPNQVLVNVLDEVRRLLKVVASSIWLIDPTTGELVCQHATGPHSDEVRGWRLAPGQGLAGWVARSGQSQIVPDTQSDRRHFKGVDRSTGLVLRSILSVPLRTKHGVIGVLQVVDTAVNRFQPADLELMEPLAATAAIAIENARLYAEEQQRAAALARALEQQQELDRLKSEFIQNVSHELRTPLSLITGYAELLDDGVLGELQPDQREPVSVIARRARMLGKLVDDLVAILAVESREFRRAPVDLAGVLHTLLADYRIAVETAGLSLTTEVASDLPTIFGNADYLGRMMDNLLGNALKFTPPGGRVTVRLQQEGDEIVLEVTDTGIGIPAERLGRIFERFYQVDGSMTRRFGGAGLGLALVKEIAEAHGGQASVQSTEGVGSTFRVRLPIQG